ETGYKWPMNISAVIEKIGNKTSDAIAALQEEVLETAKITSQNRLALDMLLASQGGVCTVINTSCCVYADQNTPGKLRKNVHSV
uniref:ERVV2 protein n=1 Tax=Dromaius novaehollandiae TaxID=8790 RepID=A0A8C4J5B6_DRONO